MHDFMSLDVSLLCVKYVITQIWCKIICEMIVQSPTTSTYPGKYVMFAFAAFFAVLAWRSSRSAMRAWSEQRSEPIHQGDLS